MIRRPNILRRAADEPIALAILWMCIALLLRLYRLEEQSLWNDEMFTLDVVSHSFGDIQTTLKAGYHHPPLYFYVAKASVMLFGFTAWAIRLPSALFGALSVGAVVLIGERMMGRRAALLAGTLLLVAPFHIAYSQEGRPYALAALLCLLSTHAFLRLLDRPTMARRCLYVAATVALLYTHHWGLFVAASHGLFGLLAARRSRKPFAPLLLIWAVVGVFYIPELLVLRHQSVAGPAAQWFWAESPSVGEIFHLGTAFSGSAFTMASSDFALPVVLQILGAAAIAAVVAGGALCLRRHGDPRGALFAVLFGTLAIPFLLSFLKPEIFLWYRYTVIPLPLLALVAGGLAQHRIRGMAPVALLIAIGALGAVAYGSWQKSSAKEVAAYVREEAGETGMVIRPSAYAPIFNYYYRGGAVQLDEAYLDTPLGSIVDTAQTFVYVSLDVPNPIRDYFDAHFAKREERRFPAVAHMGMVVGVYRQRPE